MSNSSDSPISIDRVRSLLKSLEEQDYVEANHILNDITEIRKSELFQDIGVLTRELHTTLTDFQVGGSISGVDEEKIPHARERLRYVVEMTEDAVNQTLGAVEESIPLADAIVDQSNVLSGDWERFKKREMDVDEFRRLSGDISVFMSISSENAVKMSQRLNDVMMAQSFQDLTGQVLNRVIGMVEDLEDGLVKMIKLSGVSEDNVPVSKQESGNKTAREEQLLDGPLIQGINDQDSISSQDDVDDLLASMGF
mgnify:CR=1 FL=1|jgi:chemotaxis protein CheZ